MAKLFVFKQMAEGGVRVRLLDEIACYPPEFWRVIAYMVGLVAISILVLYGATARPCVELSFRHHPPHRYIFD